MNRSEIAEIIASRLNEESSKFKEEYNKNDKIPHFYVDDLLPESLAQQCFQNFPSSEEMILKKSLKENKYISAQMDQHHPILEEVLYAFQDPKVVQAIANITGFKNLIPDENLYAGGLSRMNQNQFLQPHLDNSHDKEGTQYRVLNLLYYVNPNWKKENGGNLELWPNGLENNPKEVISHFNRLAVMATHRNSLHSVNEVVSEQSRFCISNYYFHQESPDQRDYFHVTTFFSRNNALINAYFQMDAKVRKWLRSVLPQKWRDNPHVYKKLGK